MQQKITDIITTSRHNLSNCITPNDQLWNCLDQHALNMIPKATKQQIQTKDGDYSQVTALLDHLEKRTDTDFVNFCKSLVAAKQEFVVKDHLKDALLCAGTSLEAIKIELEEQSDSSQHRPPEMRPVEVLGVNFPDIDNQVKIAKSSKEFFEKNKEQAYSVEPESRGYALIINVQYAHGGTNIDRKRIDDLLKALKFESITILHNENGLNAEEIKQKVEGFVTSISNGAKRVALFFLCQGGQGTIFATHGGVVQIDDLIQCLSPDNAPGLAEVPKLFVVQASRGSTREVAPEDLLAKNIVVCYASQDGANLLMHYLNNKGSAPKMRSFSFIYSKYTRNQSERVPMSSSKEVIVNVEYAVVWLDSKMNLTCHTLSDSKWYIISIYFLYNNHSSHMLFLKVNISTYENYGSGHIAHRSSLEGSWFVATLVKVFEEHAHRDDIIELMNKVIEKVHEHTKKNEGIAIYQVPEIQHNLTKNLYFFPGHPEFE